MIKAVEGGGPTQKQVVLVVEDEPIISFGRSLHLQQNDFEVREAESVDDAIAVLKEPGCIVQLVFSDVRMPGKLDGIGLSRWIFENRPNIAVILASGELGKATALQDLCGAETMTKPFDYGSVTSRIRDEITKKTSPPS